MSIDRVFYKRDFFSVLVVNDKLKNLKNLKAFSFKKIQLTINYQLLTGKI